MSHKQVPGTVKYDRVCVRQAFLHTGKRYVKYGAQVPVLSSIPDTW